MAAAALGISTNTPVCVNKSVLIPSERTSVFANRSWVLFKKLGEQHHKIGIVDVLLSSPTGQFVPVAGIYFYHQSYEFDIFHNPDLVPAFAWDFVPKSHKELGVSCLHHCSSGCKTIRNTDGDLKVVHNINDQNVVWNRLRWNL